MTDFTNITIIGEQGKGKTMYLDCPYCGMIDHKVVIMFHIQNCPKRPKTEGVK